jgi:Tfp pilus assembly pilus retraction ATPase PilT
MQTGRAHGMLTFESSVNELTRSGFITRDEGQNFLMRRSAGVKKTRQPAPAHSQD